MIFSPQDFSNSFFERIYTRISYSPKTPNSQLFVGRKNK
jgi:hypothetical protein